MRSSLPSVRGVRLAAAAAALSAVILSPLLVWAATTFTTVDSTGSVGFYSSLALGSDGLPVIAYYDGSNSDLKTAKCANSGCTVSTRTTVDSSGNTGHMPSMAVDSSGRPVIAYLDNSTNDLRVAKCGNSGCTVSTRTTVDSTGAVGFYAGIALGTDGYPVISYQDSTNSDLKVAKCTNSGCTTATTITTVDSVGGVGGHTSIAIGADGYPVISYQDSNNLDLKVAKCTNSGCTTATTITTVDSAGSVGAHTSIAIGADGYPVISYQDSSNLDLKVAKCTNSGCTTATTITTVDSAGSVGLYTSIAIGADDYPLIAYYSSTSGDLKVAKCSNSGCTTHAVRTVDATGSVGIEPTIVVAGDGFPMISYYDNSNADLKFAHCDTASCRQISAPAAVTDLASGVTGDDVSLSWTNPTTLLFSSVSIRRSTTGFPASITDGTAVTTTSGTSTTDSDLATGVYFYSVFAQDIDGNVSAAANVTAHVSDGSQGVCSMIAHWPFDSSPTAPPDATGHGFTGTYGGTAPSLSTDVPAVSFTDPYSFSFSSGYVQVTRPVQDDFTLCTWLKTTAQGAGSTTQHYLSRALMHAELGGLANDFGFGMDANEMLVYGDGGSGGDTGIHGSTTINTGNWVHACVTRKKSNGSVHLYVNGVHDGSGSGNTVSLNSAGSMYIGYGQDGAAYWDGQMDDVRVYDYVLDSSAILTLAGGGPGSCSSGDSAPASEEAPAETPSRGGGRRGSPGRGGVAPSLSDLRKAAPTASSAPMLTPSAPASSASSAERPVETATPDDSLYPFSDVAPGVWFQPYVERVTAMGFFEGYKDSNGLPLGRFGSADPITLGQLAKVAALMGGKSVTPGEGGAWAAPYLASAKDAGYATFAVPVDENAEATRGAVIRTILEALGIPAADKNLPYSDVPADSPYAKAIATATNLGIVSGDDGKDTFRPEAPVNRAEVAKMIVRAIESQQ